MRKENKTAVEYLSDSSVNELLDQELRNLFSLCFTKPEDMVFKERRYFREPYPNRWVIRDDRKAIIAHVGVHEKQILADNQTYRIGGIAEVCVHPDFRGRKFVKAMLVRAHEWLIQNGFVFAVLFGRPEIYSSSGYTQVNNLYHDSYNADNNTPYRKQATVMIKELSDKPWPRSDVYLPGPTF